MGLNLERIGLWADALESDEFEQTTGALKAEIWDDGKPSGRYGYCCLGVACVVAARNGGPVAFGDNEAAMGYMPRPVAEWYGLDSANSDRSLVAQVDPMLITDDGGRAYAARLNDGAGFTFKRIAAAVRHTFLE